MRILIVENNYEVNKLFGIGFKKLGYANDIVETVFCKSLYFSNIL